MFGLEGGGTYAVEGILEAAPSRFALPWDRILCGWQI